MVEAKEISEFVSWFVIPVFVFKLLLESSGIRLLLRNGGCIGTGTAHSGSLSISTTSDMDGRKSGEAWVQRSAIRSTFNASETGNLPFNAGSMHSASLFDLYCFQT